MLHGCANLKAGCGRHSINNFDAQPASEVRQTFELLAIYPAASSKTILARSGDGGVLIEVSRMTGTSVPRGQPGRMQQSNLQMMSSSQTRWARKRFRANAYACPDRESALCITL